MLFDVTPTDPMAFAAVVSVLVVAATLACYVPARRGTRVNPVEALRQE
jgi:putative ABC transport system permease protein